MVKDKIPDCDHTLSGLFKKIKGVLGGLGGCDRSVPLKVTIFDCTYRYTKDTHIIDVKKTFPRQFFSFLLID
jgi:hypothetical protein